MNCHAGEAPVLDFGVLGPLLVVVGGEVRPIGPRKHRILLAALLLRANQPVHMAELIDRLWQAAPPNGARRTVQTYAMRLRRELGAAGPLIKTRPEAYTIELPREQLDLGRFTELTARAAAQRTAGDLVAARSTLRAAIAQWRGTPLSDVPSAALVHSDVPHLVGELRSLVAEHPLRERFWALLMRTLCQAGRYAEAVRTYHEADQLLDAELGVAPSHELRRLHLDALAGTTTTPEELRGAGLDRLRSLLTEDVAIITQAKP
jgi:pentatricopeptide repeat protein